MKLCICHQSLLQLYKSISFRDISFPVCNTMNNLNSSHSYALVETKARKLLNLQGALARKPAISTLCQMGMASADHQETLGNFWMYLTAIVLELSVDPQITWGICLKNRFPNPPMRILIGSIWSGTQQCTSLLRTSNWSLKLVGL